MPKSSWNSVSQVAHTLFAQRPFSFLVFLNPNMHRSFLRKNHRIPWKHGFQTLCCDLENQAGPSPTSSWEHGGKVPNIVRPALQPSPPTNCQAIRMTVHKSSRATWNSVLLFLRLRRRLFLAKHQQWSETSKAIKPHWRWLKTTRFGILSY